MNEEDLKAFIVIPQQKVDEERLRVIREDKRPMMFWRIVAAQETNPMLEVDYQGRTSQKYFPEPCGLKPQT